MKKQTEQLKKIDLSYMDITKKSITCPVCNEDKNSIVYLPKLSFKLNESQKKILEALEDKDKRIKELENKLNEIEELANDRTGKNGYCGNPIQVYEIKNILRSVEDEV